MNDIKLVNKIAQDVKSAGGRTFYVGGYVRDKLLGKENKDIDIEVHGITLDRFKDILENIGELDERKVGDNFGIFALKGYDVDIAMPRSEVPSGSGGHKDFVIDVDPFIGYKKACKRRDFTINAMMQDVLSGEILDYFGGQDDISNKIIRHVDDNTFKDDPLRVFRAAQFASRFDFKIADNTIELSKQMDVSKLSHERISKELSKALMKSDKPSVFFNELYRMNQLDIWFPEVKALIGVQQSETFHPEGDAYTHTMMVIDEAAKYKMNTSHPEWFMISALCHDFGKAVTTEFNEKKQDWTSYEHDTKGVPIVEEFLRRVYNDNRMSKYVCKVVEQHMIPLQLALSSTNKKKYMQFFDTCVNGNDMILLSKCDNDGRTSDRDFTKMEKILREMLSEYESLMKKPQVSGSDLQNIGYKPGPKFHKMLEYTHKVHLSGLDRDEALRQMIGMFGKPDEDRQMMY